MARSVVALVALLSCMAGVPAEDMACTDAETCEAEMGSAMLQRSKQTVYTDATSNDDLMEGVYADLAIASAGREEEPAEFVEDPVGEGPGLLQDGGDDDGVAEGVRECICGRDKFNSDAKIEHWKGKGCAEVFRYKWLQNTCKKEPEARVIGFLKSMCCEMSSDCLCGKGEEFQGDKQVPSWSKGRICKKELHWACKADESHPGRKYLKSMCCGGAKGCGGDLCPEGTKLLPKKKSHVHAGKQYFCKDADWWYKNGAEKAHCPHIEEAWVPKCCKDEGYGSNTD
mmetsp:Transcript_7946/g.18280  ORF Transcript_7946/g.18280 Transcript_7946/m.18280 type:complete len:284 (+) Transcript_7946:100-951(+)